MRISVATALAALVLVSVMWAPASASAESQTVQGSVRKDFAAPYESVKYEAMESAKRLGAVIAEADEMEGRYRIRFEKGVTWITRGVIGEIDVFRIDESTTGVLVTLYARGRAQDTLMSNRQLTDQIFGYISASTAVASAP
jgi:hypothetical protein